MKRFAIAGLVFVLLLGAAAAGWFAWTQFVDPRYRATATLLLKPNPFQHDAAPASDLAPARGAADPTVFSRERLARLSSEELLRNTVRWPDAQTTAWVQSFEGDVIGAADALAAALRTRVVPETRLVELHVDLADPDDAKMMLGSLLAVFTNDAESQLEADAALAHAAYERERERALEELRRVQQERSRFIRDNDLAGTEPPGPPHGWIAQRQLEAEFAYEAVRRATRNADDPDAAAAERAGELNEARIQCDAWNEAAAQAQAQRRDHEQKLQSLRTIDAASRSAQNQIDHAEGLLRDTRTARSRAHAAGVQIISESQEARRVAWRWPWD